MIVYTLAIARGFALWKVLQSDLQQRPLMVFACRQPVYVLHSMYFQTIWVVLDSFLSLQD